MNKQQLAEALAQAVNMVNELQAWNNENLTPSQSNGICKLLEMLPENVRSDFANNWDIKAKDLLKR